jgi:hypothetical protein
MQEEGKAWLIESHIKVEIPKKEYQKNHKETATMNTFGTLQILRHDEVPKF